MDISVIMPFRLFRSFHPGLFHDVSTGNTCPLPIRLIKLIVSDRKKKFLSNALMPMPLSTELAAIRSFFI